MIIFICLFVFNSIYSNEKFIQFNRINYSVNLVKGFPKEQSYYISNDVLFKLIKKINFKLTAGIMNSKDTELYLGYPEISTRNYLILSSSPFIKPVKSNKFSLYTGLGPVLMKRHEIIETSMLIPLQPENSPDKQPANYTLNIINDYQLGFEFFINMNYILFKSFAVGLNGGFINGNRNIITSFYFIGLNISYILNKNNE